MPQVQGLDSAPGEETESHELNTYDDINNDNNKDNDNDNDNNKILLQGLALPRKRKTTETTKEEEPTSFPGSLCR